MDGNSDDEDEQMPNGDISSNLREDDDDLRDPVNVRMIIKMCSNWILTVINLLLSRNAWP